MAVAVADVTAARLRSGFPAPVSLPLSPGRKTFLMIVGSLQPLVASADDHLDSLLKVSDPKTTPTRAYPEASPFESRPASTFALCSRYQQEGVPQAFTLP